MTKYPTKQLDKLLNFITSDKYIDGESIKEIPNTNSNYYVTDKGRVISLCNNHARVLKQFKTSYQNNQYNCVDILDATRDERVTIKVNRLVAEAFIDNPDNKPIVHHIDFDKLNNDVSNLMWVTSTEHGELHSGKSRAQVASDE